ncbi:hypothetical protein L226DRAFT_573459 [Lentinus tigrinus ALCF2SS1-7]|uniref:Uncharacterized protein n=1 Tax=Lentinus tigrinus ALCF2SS1-6 TaxID=1328759 RepID=A0A5C2S3K3_9APHY|nr:hypothetical protein L227DRAFT_613737 [Lentinus tigrinus ALCF2SS1-6]RPD72102.1 hypothetical protein L226DRAFT_573459 [Lentinus tigrinus ALCF2SS1-7]
MITKPPPDVTTDAPGTASAPPPPPYTEAPKDGEAITWTAEPRHFVLGERRAHTSLAFPMAAEELFFVAKGEHSRGDFEISLTGDRGPDIAVVDVDVMYHQEHALDEVTVCHLRPEDGKEGLGIYTRHDWQATHHGFDSSLHFRIHLRFPALAPGHTPFIVNQLTTDLPAFTHHFRCLGSGMTFRRVKLESSICTIEGETLAGEEVTLISTNSQVRGNFTVSKLLDIKTSNAPIIIRASLVNKESELTEMAIRTSNARIEAQVALESTGPDYSGGSFRVAAQTTNAPTLVVFKRHPVDAVLDAIIQTTNAPARVTMHPAFEGRFELRSSPYLFPSIHELSTVTDPAGRGRVRELERYDGKGDVHGRVWWKQPQPEVPAAGTEDLATGPGAGRLSVETTNSPIDVSL